MRLDHTEIQAIADALARHVADILERRLSERPEWAFSVGEAAAWAQVEPHVIRDAVADGRLPCIRIGRSVRIRRTDLFGLRNGHAVDPRKE
jgi:excisionase family DNA binding protein